MSSGNPLIRPGPPPLPRAQQKEFEELVRTAQAPLSSPSSSAGMADASLTLHPDARAPLSAEFDGEVNPVTGEKGGPKREPVGKWGDLVICTIVFNFARTSINIAIRLVTNF
ncbi:Succinate dehydrogenase assembly factor 4, mitochondrial [Grifola frondosa]|uniref:Succinate dehydrogenase assembly factor 4, mitochondrial n=1 Tax=Grifola frondosa TaxID=5627 RepID=A0A1C7LWH1_GRIFR|nr:Succinate dehydrogenase assembly factor 4, mitochondrial [Grifola frondosa]